MPFFTDAHRDAVEVVSRFADEQLREGEHEETIEAVDRRARSLVRALGEAGLTRYCVRAAHGGTLEDFDARAICLIREALAYHDGLADFAFAMQGLGS